MQAQISALTASVHSLAQSNASASMPRSEAGPRLHRRISMASKELTFQGPTTSGFSFDLAKSSLKERGIEVERNEGDITREPSPLPTPPSPGSCHVGDPLWSISKTEALRLCRVYEEEMGVMYPVVELDQLLHNVHLLYGPTETGPWLQAPAHAQGIGELDSDDVHILRLVFACALTAEASGSSELAMSLFATVRDAADHYVWAAPELKSITLLALVVSRTSGVPTNLTGVGDIVFPDRRGDPCLANDRDCGTNVLRERAAPKRNTQASCYSESRKEPRAQAVLVGSGAGFEVELRNGHAV